MTSKAGKLAVAAAVVIAVLLGLHFFRGPFASGVTWADVIVPIFSADTAVLAIIIGNSELAIDTVPESNSAGKCLKEILSASFRAKDLVDRILGFARKSVFQLMPVPIGQIIGETLKLIETSLPSNIAVRQDLLCKSDLVMADAAQVGQALINHRPFLMDDLEN